MADDELSHRRAVDRAARAKALVNDELLQEGFKLFEEDLLRIWRNSPTGASVERERVWSMMKAIDMVRKHLEGVIADGKVSAQVIADMLGRTAA
jgi:hypothetical protein